MFLYINIFVTFCFFCYWKYIKKFIFTVQDL